MAEHTQAANKTQSDPTNLYAAQPLFPVLIMMLET